MADWVSHDVVVQINDIVLHIALETKQESWLDIDTAAGWLASYLRAVSLLGRHLLGGCCRCLHHLVWIV